MYILDFVERKAVPAAAGTRTTLQVDDREGAALRGPSSEPDSTLAGREEMRRTGEDREESPDAPTDAPEASPTTVRGKNSAQLIQN